MLFKIKMCYSWKIYLVEFFLKVTSNTNMIFIQTKGNFYVFIAQYCTINKSVRSF